MAAGRGRQRQREDGRSREREDGRGRERGWQRQRKRMAENGRESELTSTKKIASTNNNQSNSRTLAVYPN
jgi:hypothetical protein